MVRYLKYIVLIFGSLGIIIGSFFVYQNRVDISTAMEYNSILDYENLRKTCLGIEKDYYYPCLKKKFAEFLSKVSLTGTNIGMKMMFTVIDEDKAKTTFFETEKQKQIEYTINYLEINNMAIDNVYKRYFGMETMYGGFIASLNKYYDKAYEFSENLIIGLDSHEGIKSLESKAHQEQANKRFQLVKEEFYRFKQESQDFIESEIKRLEASTK